MKRHRPSKLNRASAYYRLAMKAMYAGKSVECERYTKIADRLVAENRRDRISSAPEGK